MLKGEEKISVRVFKRDQDLPRSSRLINDMFLLDRITKRRKKRYVRYVFEIELILGTVDKIAGQILTDKRMKIAPHLFASLIFVRHNDHFWDPYLVIRAREMTKSN